LSLHRAVGCPACGAAPDELGRGDGGADRPCVPAGAGAGAPAGGAISAAPPAATPPWCEQAPLPPFDSEPSLHFTIGVDAGADEGAGAGLVAGALLGAGALAPAATPPWCEQAPLPPLDVVPSLQVTVDSVSATATDIRAVPANAKATRMSHFIRRMLRLPPKAMLFTRRDAGHEAATRFRSWTDW